MSDKKDDNEQQQQQQRVQRRDVRRVVLALDGSDSSWHALEYALTRVLRAKDHVVLVHVFDYVEYDAECGFGISVNVDEVNEQMHQTAKKEAEDLLDKMVKRVVEHRGGAEEPHVRQVLLRGSAKDEILAFLEEETQKGGDNNRIDLVVMASRGLGGIGRTFLGSCSDAILHSSPVPVMVVKNPDDHKDDPAAKKSE